MQIAVRKSDVVWNYAGTALSMTASLIILPFVLYFLTPDEVGMYYVFVSLAAVTTVFDFGFSPTFSKNVAYAWSGVPSLRAVGSEESQSDEPNYELLSSLLSTCRVIYAGISLLALAVMLPAGAAYISSISDDAVAGSGVAWALYAIAIFLNLLFGYYAVFLRGIGDIKGINQAIIASKLVQVGLSALMLILGFGLLGVSIPFLVGGALLGLVSRILLFRNDRMRANVKGRRLASRRSIADVLRTLWHNTWRDGLVSFSLYALGQGSVVFCGMTASLAEVGMYSLAMQFANAVGTLSLVPYTASFPSIQSFYANRDFDGLGRTVSTNWAVFLGLYLAGSVALIVLLPLLSLVKPEYELTVGMLAAVLLYVFMTNFRNFFTNYFSCTNRIVYFRALLVSALLALALMAAFSLFGGFGVYGVLAALMLSQAVYNVWRWPSKAIEDMGLTVRSFARAGISGAFGLLKNRGA